MAKVRHNNFLETVTEVISHGVQKGALHLYAEGEHFDGRFIRIKGEALYHFGTTGYLGLEQDPRLKKAAIEAIERYGTQFPLSKTYISHPLYRDLERKITEIYANPIIITKNSTLGHMAVIPSIVADGDGVILDHQVHWSVQSAVNPLKLRSVPVEMIRHNRMDMLEDKILKLRDSCGKIWYMADGIYSMYGDYAPIADLMALSQKYPQLHIYFDDVHGMSWKGRNGNGYVMSQLGQLPENVILFGTLSKTFGASGAVMVCKDKDLHRKVKNFGGPLTFSAQLEPASVGAAIASAGIHLSPEIDQLQEELAGRIAYFNHLLKQTELPLISTNDSPVFYIGTGMPETGYNLVNRLIQEGFYVNLGLFPAVPVKNTGLRITISRHNRKEEIKALRDALVYHHPRALEETFTTLQKVNFFFGRDTSPSGLKSQRITGLKLQTFRTIHAIDPEQWNKSLGNRSIFDWRGLEFLEQAFSGNPLPEHNYAFYYFIITDSEGNWILATFFTYGMWKEDMLAPGSVSRQLEENRKEDPYLHTSYCLGMGSMVTEGQHLFLDSTHSAWNSAFNLLLQELEVLEKDLKPQTLIMRDFDPQQKDIKAFLHNKGFVQVAMPQSAQYTTLDWNTPEEYVETLSKRSRKHFRKEIAAFRPHFQVVVAQHLCSATLEKAHALYLEVKQRNPGLNTFSYPFALFQQMNDSPCWEFILLSLKDHQDLPLVGVMFCYRNSSQRYVPNLIGMNYRYAHEFKVYRQLLYQTILRAKALDCHSIDFGMTAGFEKRKVGARVLDQCAYIQTRDNFALEALDWLRRD